MELHLRRLAGLGARTVFLEVDEHNKPAIRLYDRAGFHEISRRPNYYPVPGGKAAAALVLRRGEIQLQLPGRFWFFNNFIRLEEALEFLAKIRGVSVAVLKKEAEAAAKKRTRKEKRRA